MKIIHINLNGVIRTTITLIFIITYIIIECKLSSSVSCNGPVKILGCESIDTFYISDKKVDKSGYAPQYVLNDIAELKYEMNRTQHAHAKKLFNIASEHN